MTTEWIDAQGKPSPDLLYAVMARAEVSPHQTAFIGDRLCTDMEMARRANVLAILVLCGETSAADLSGSPTKPDLVVADLGQLAKWLPCPP
jgi:ribonucleotide monophosphatase NagD (HAD superfamily)